MPTTTRVVVGIARIGARACNSGALCGLARMQGDRVSGDAQRLASSRSVGEDRARLLEP